MSKPRILIIGDSFAADWSVKYNKYKGWPNLLAEQYPVVNLAQAGVSEYKIYRQLCSIKNLDDFDLVIVSHTSPLRVATRRHPVHANDPLHANADLMLGDIEYHQSRLKNIFNRSLQAAYNFFMYHYDVEYFETTYRLLRDQINRMLQGKPVIVVSNLADLENFITEKTVLNFHNLLETERGVINHMTESGNKQIYQTLLKTIKVVSIEKATEE